MAAFERERMRPVPSTDASSSPSCYFHNRTFFLAAAIRFVLSAGPGPSYDALIAMGCRRIKLLPLSDTQRRTFIQTVMRQASKSITVRFRKSRRVF